MLDSSHPRIVAVDYGTKRVGIALSDPLGMFAQPYGTFDAAGAVEAVRRIRDAHGLERLLVGWPLTPDGDEGRATRFVQPFINRLKNAFPGVPVEKRDERFTSEDAKAAIRAAGARRAARRDRARVDAAAAAIILQQYLDEHDA